MLDKHCCNGSVMTPMFEIQIDRLIKRCKRQRPWSRKKRFSVKSFYVQIKWRSAEMSDIENDSLSKNGKMYCVLLFQTNNGAFVTNYLHKSGSYRDPAKKLLFFATLNIIVFVVLQ